jgi:hypothetical protein
MGIRRYSIKEIQEGIPQWRLRQALDTDENDHRLELLHTNVRRFGTISNTVAEAAKLEGTIRRKA